MKRRIAALILGSGLFSFAAFADDALPDHDLSEWKFGETIVNEPVSAEALKGKVTVIEYWGTR